MFKQLIILAIIAVLVLIYFGYKQTNKNTITVEITKPKIETK